MSLFAGLSGFLSLSILEVKLAIFPFNSKPSLPYSTPNLTKAKGFPSSC